MENKEIIISAKENLKKLEAIVSAVKNLSIENPLELSLCKNTFNWTITAEEAEEKLRKATSDLAFLRENWEYKLGAGNALLDLMRGSKELFNKYVDVYEPYLRLLHERSVIEKELFDSVESGELSKDDLADTGFGTDELFDCVEDHSDIIVEPYYYQI